MKLQQDAATIKRLEANDWESVPSHEVSVDLARKVLEETVQITLGKDTVISRIQILSVNSGMYTDASFMAKLVEN